MTVQEAQKIADNYCSKRSKFRKAIYGKTAGKIMRDKSANIWNRNEGEEHHLHDRLFFSLVYFDLT